MRHISELHQRAMELADRSLLARVAGETVSAKELLRQAFETERQAAETGSDAPEPTRSILFRSAASLALEVGEVRTAERLIAMGLAGEPPQEIAEDLRDLLEQVHFQRHLALRGIQLLPGEFQLSLAGQAVGFGMADSDAFVERVRTIETLIYRTAERKQGREFRERGRRRESLQRELRLFVSMPRAASFAVTFRLGSGQLALPGLGFVQEVVDEVLDCFDLFAREQTTTLRERIPDDAYFNNFMGLANRVVPDGEEIRTVGLTAVHNGTERRVALSPRPRESGLRRRQQPGEPPSDVTVVRGFLKASDSRNERRGYIMIVDADGREHKVRVPPGMMRDIVRPMYEDEVVVTGRPKGALLLLASIDPVR
jgi:hypothetical protein